MSLDNSTTQKKHKKNDPGESTNKDEKQELFLPVTGFVWLYKNEIEIVNHPCFQRLGRINQLGQTNVVYRGATHKRLEHVLGTVHVVQRMIDAIKHTSLTRYGEKEAKQYYLNDKEERFVRLGALLHDIGHVAMGHTLEDELDLFKKHDDDHRLDLLLNNKNKVKELLVL